MAQETSDMNEPVLHPAPAEGFGAALTHEAVRVVLLRQEQELDGFIVRHVGQAGLQRCRERVRPGRRRRHREGGQE